MTRPALTGLVLALAVLASAPAAHAGKLCVGLDATACPDGKRFGADRLQAALDEAASNGTGDALEIAARDDFDGAFVYESFERIVITGAGRGKTVLRSRSDRAALKLISPSSEVRDLTLVSDTDMRGALPSALDLGATARRVRAQNTTDSEFARAATLRGSGTIEDSQLVAPSGDGVWTTLGAVKPTIRDTSISAGVRGVYVSGGAELRLERVTVTSGGTAAQAIDASLEVDNSLLRTSAQNAAAGLAALGKATVVADHTTVVSRDAAEGIAARGALNNVAKLTFSNGIIDGFSTAIARSSGDGRADVTVRYSAFPSTLGSVYSRGPGALDLGTGNTDAKPQFADPVVSYVGDTLDFRLRGASRLIDRGDPADLGGIDLAGSPRVFGPRSDIGAYEFQGVEPAGPDGEDGPGGTGPGGEEGGDGPGGTQGRPGKDSTKPKLSRLKRTRSRLSFRLTEAARVTIRFERRTKRGKFARVKKGTLTFTARAGTNKLVLPKRLKAGTLRARLKPRDLAGNKGTTKSIRFRLVRS